MAKILELQDTEHLVPANDSNGQADRPKDSHLSVKTLADCGIDVSFTKFQEWWTMYLKK